METIKANMSPNPLDVQTIHASQNDGEARQWGFELHNNGELIDTSDITEQLFFKAYKGGTEQLLPENGSVPTTSPFKGDIRYPQGLLTDQEFIYRQSPTEEDGLAKITDIKGNTIVWNQLVENGNFESTDGWRIPNGTASASNNVLTVTATGSSLQIMMKSNYTLTQGHKIYISCWVKASVAKNDVRLRISQDTPFAYTQYISKDLNANVRTNISGIITVERDTTNSRFSIFVQNSADGEVYTVDSFVAFDLTKMGLDSITDPSEFTSLFSLPYYSYNQGSLLSFMGEQIKTTGKNLLEPATSGSVSSVTFTVNNDGSITVNGTATSYGTYDLYRNQNVLPSWAKAGETYTLSLTNVIDRFDIFSYDSSGTSKSLASISSITSQAFTIPNNAVGMLIRVYISSGITYDVTIYPQIEIGASATSYEPYTSSALSLPISTYFPSGMKSAGNVYDELTESKAITRIGSVDLGSLTWSYVNQQYNIFQADLTDMKANADWQRNVNFCSSMYHPSPTGMSSMDDLGVRQVGNNLKQIIVRNTAYTDATAFKTAMSGVYLYYEMATETETSFTTASLVTENAEIPLSNNDGVLIGKCTEQLSENPGFIDAKIKLSDSYGECYSNKIQLHVERSPQ